MIPTLRILTRKSTLKFGKYKDYTVQKLLDLRRHTELISPYFKLTSINYTQDILDELKIKGDWAIEKPGARKDMYFDFISQNGFYRRKSHGGADKMRKESKVGSKSTLQRKNQGH